MHFTSAYNFILILRLAQFVYAINKEDDAENERHRIRSVQEKKKKKRKNLVRHCMKRKQNKTKNEKIKQTASATVKWANERTVKYKGLSDR